MALGGDASVMRALLDRLIAPRRERPVSIAMPRISAASDLIAAASALTDAVASGEITPGEAASLGVLVGNVANAVQVASNEERIAALEQALASGKS
jgi:hypothetical protein